MSMYLSTAASQSRRWATTRPARDIAHALDRGRLEFTQRRGDGLRVTVDESAGAGTRRSG